MFETSDSEINVDRLMHEIRKTVARQHRSTSQSGSESLSDFSFIGKPGSHSPEDSSSLSLQPEFHFRRDDRYHSNDFLKYHGGDFVRNAYRALLKREPDPAGYAQYLESLASGRFNKVDILAKLRYSPEGERAGVKVAGLAWPATIRRLERVPIIGYVLQMVIAVGRLPRLLQHLRQSEFHLLAQQQRIVDDDNQVHKQLADAVAQISAQALAGTEKTANQQQVIDSLLQQQQGTVRQQSEIRDTIESGLTAARQYVDQCTAALTSKVEEQTQKLLGQQQQLAEQLEGQTQGLLRRQQQTHTELIMQERRLTVLLEEAQKYPPAALDQPRARVMSNEADHLLDPLYASFEDQFRGSREEIKDRVRAYLPILKDAGVIADVLDIGCGRGEWLELLRNEGVQARGVDHNRIFVEQCRHIGLEVMEEDALAYLRSLTENSLNAITSFHLVEHLRFEELIKLLDEIVRTLRSGGLVILETPNPENFIVGSYSFYADPTHRNPIPSPTLKFLLESRGLGRIDVVKLRPWDAAKIDGSTELIKRFNEYFYSAPDYGIIGWKV